MKFTMHKVKVLTIASLIVCAFLFEIVQAKSDTRTNNPGSVSDPIVTKSYVNAKINSLKQQIDKSIAGININGTNAGVNQKDLSDLNVKIKYLIQTNNQLVNSIKDLKTKYEQLKSTNTNNSPVQTSSSFKLVMITQNKKLYLNEGSELILRTGTIITYSNKDNGFVDVTTGNDTKYGENLPKNHLIVCPKYDSRYLFIKSKSYVLIKGLYILK
jgi:hypothetical protein